MRFNDNQVLTLRNIKPNPIIIGSLEKFVTSDISDLIMACEARIEHGDRASQFLVDQIQFALREGDETAATRADRALQLLSACGSGRGKRRKEDMMTNTKPDDVEDKERRGEDRRKALPDDFKGRDRRAAERRG